MVLVTDFAELAEIADIHHLLGDNGIGVGENLTIAVDDQGNAAFAGFGLTHEIRQIIQTDFADQDRIAGPRRDGDGGGAADRRHKYVGPHGGVCAACLDKNRVRRQVEVAEVAGVRATPAVEHDVVEPALWINQI